MGCEMKPGPKVQLPNRDEFIRDCETLRWFELEEKYGVCWSRIKSWKKRMGLTDGKKHDRVVVSEVLDSGCHRCTSHSSSHGYPRGNRGPVVKRLWMSKNGEWPSGKLTRHLCGNKWCANPDHIVPGDNFENNVDTLLDGQKKLDAAARGLLARAICEGLIEVTPTGLKRLIDGKVFPILASEIEKKVRVTYSGKFERLSVESPLCMNEGGEVNCGKRV